MENEKKIIAEYKVTRFSDGSTDVENIEVEGVEPLSKSTIFSDIEEIGETVKLKRIENASYIGVKKFFAELQAAAIPDVGESK